MRQERDSLGWMELDENSYYGIFTERAKRNFRISGIKANPNFLKALATIKKAAANANVQTGVIDQKTGHAISEAAQMVISGKFSNQFPLDVFQAGAGTPFNMNMNEVIANISIELLGGKKGQYALVHPNNHVNMSQSSNDVIPTAIRIALLFESENLLTSLNAFSNAISQAASKHENDIRPGRTHLQDAVPTTFGQTIGSYAFAVNKCIERIISARAALQELGIGGTAIGTGINTHPRFKKEIAGQLKNETGYELRISEDTIATTWSHATLLDYSSALRVLAADMSKICDDLMLLNSGPKTGMAEITLPEVEPGSSIMPGKVNPSIPECMKMICFQAIGNDLAVMEAAKSGNLELNVYTPLIGFDLLWSTEILTKGLDMMTELCIKPIRIHKERAAELVKNSLIAATALNPYLGYEVVAEIVKLSLKSNKPIRDIIIENQIMEEKHLQMILDPAGMTHPGNTDKSLATSIKESEGFKRFVSSFS
ncbi:aspartate ammonia-lyase [Candidatus Woesearchaeota archaeon]|nr:aspartate ammonia-lyase [Candidatus Woesearchaeota archaeon]